MDLNDEATRLALESIRLELASLRNIIGGLTVLLAADRDPHMPKEELTRLWTEFADMISTGKPKSTDENKEEQK